MASTTIERRVLRWPAERKVALAEKLLDSVANFATREIGQEIQRRVIEIKNGETMGITAKAALAKARRILSEARSLPQARVCPAGSSVSGIRQTR